MLITIAERFRPFIHLSGVRCLLPNSTLSFQIYPAFLKVFELSISTPSLVAEFPIAVDGPVKGFTVMQDLEKGCIKVWGESAKGFFRYRIEPKIGFIKDFSLIPEKMPEVLPVADRGQASSFNLSKIERLSFGVTKKNDWQLINRRLLLPEILPFWFRLGQMVPAISPHRSGTASLLDAVEKALACKSSLDLATAFENLFLAGFEGLLSPTLMDDGHQGFGLPHVEADGAHSPLLLLTKGSELIKRMLVDVENVELHILPCLIPALHAGRICDVTLGEIGRLDLEWSKKQARRLIFHSAQEQTLTFKFQRDLSSFRLRKAGSATASIKTCGESIMFRAGTYFLDNFQS